MTIPVQPVHAMSSCSDATLRASERGHARFASDAFGVSVHYGLWSTEGEKEWIQCLDRIDRRTYMRRFERFDPSGFDAGAWVDEFVRAGATAFMVTTKHHDGFCLFASRHSDFTAANAPRSRRDLIAELADACRKRGVALHFYHSLIDWHHPLMSSVDFEPASDFAGYLAFLEAQLTELLTGYGPIAGVLFDGWWPRTRATADQGEVIKEDRWPFGRIYDLVHRLQPDCMLTNNHHCLPLPGEDYQVWEIDIPGENTVGFNCTDIGALPRTAWMTATANGWSWQPSRSDYVPAEVLRERFRRCRALGANWFQNLGPMGDGRLNPAEVELLRRLDVPGLLRGG